MSISFLTGTNISLRRGLTESSLPVKDLILQVNNIEQLKINHPGARQKILEPMKKLSINLWAVFRRSSIAEFAAEALINPGL